MFTLQSLRKLLNDKSKPLVIPGVYDAIGARIVQKIGFKAMFQTGYGTSAISDLLKICLQPPQIGALLQVSIR